MGTDEAEVVRADRQVASRSNRRTRLKRTAGAFGVPLPTILVTVGVVAAVYLLGLLAYRLREILFLILIATFFALILNPFVQVIQRRTHRRGAAVVAVMVIGAAAFLGLAAAFGYPLANGMADLAHQVPADVRAAQHGHGVIGQLVRHFHLQKWVDTNAPKIQGLGANLAKPALTVGKGAAVVIGEILAVLTLVALLLLEGPRIRSALLASMSPKWGAWCQRVGSEMQRSSLGYVFGDLLTSVIAGVVVGVTMLILGLPFPILWAVWVALVDFLPQIGGALAGIPTVLFALVHSLTDGIILAVVFLVYQQVENHLLNPLIMSRTVRTSPLLIFLAVLVGGSIGAWIDGPFGAFCAALLAVPTAASLQILIRELWLLTGAELDSDESSAPNQ